MKEVIENICEVIDEYGAELCDIDTLVRTDKYGEEFLSCEDCIYKGTEANILVCPYVWNIKMMREVIC